MLVLWVLSSQTEGPVFDSSFRYRDKPMAFNIGIDCFFAKCLILEEKVTDLSDMPLKRKFCVTEGVGTPTNLYCDGLERHACVKTCDNSPTADERKILEWGVIQHANKQKIYNGRNLPRSPTFAWCLFRATRLCLSIKPNLITCIKASFCEIYAFK